MRKFAPIKNPPKNDNITNQPPAQNDYEESPFPLSRNEINRRRKEAQREEKLRKLQDENGLYKPKTTH